MVTLYNHTMTYIHLDLDSRVLDLDKTLPRLKMLVSKHDLDGKMHINTYRLL